MSNAADRRMQVVQSICLTVATLAAFGTVAAALTQAVIAPPRAAVAPVPPAMHRPAAVSIVPIAHAVQRLSSSAAEAPMPAPPPADDADDPMRTPTPRRVFDAASPAVVAVVVRDADQNVIARTSGFIVSADGLIVTALRPLRGLHSAAAVLDNNAQLPIQSIAHQDAVADLAVLATAGRNLPHLKLADEAAPRIGSTLYAVAAPPDFDHTLDAGMVTGYRAAQGERPAASRIRTNLALPPAAVGAPLLDDDARVVAIVSNTEGSGHAALATPVIALAEMLDGEAPAPQGPLAVAVAAVIEPTTSRSAEPPASPEPQATPPLDDPSPIRGPITEADRLRAAEALGPFVATELEPAEADALALGLRLAAMQARLESMGPTLEQLAVRAMDLADAADRIARSTASPQQAHRAMTMKLEYTQRAFDARQGAKLRNALDVVHDYERQLAHGGSEDFGLYLRARQVAAYPPGTFTRPLGVGSGYGAWVSAPIAVHRTAAAWNTAPAPGADYSYEADAPAAAETHGASE